MLSPINHPKNGFNPLRQVRKATWIQIQTPGYTQLQENCNNAIYDKWVAFDNKEGVSFSQFIWKYEQQHFQPQTARQTVWNEWESKDPEKAADHWI